MQGETCGALTGGVLVLGLLHGRDRLEDTHRKEAAYVKAGEFVRGFTSVNGAARCQDLIDLKIDTPEGLEQYYARNLKSERCTPVVRNAVRLLLESLSA